MAMHASRPLVILSLGALLVVSGGPAASPTGAIPWPSGCHRVVKSGGSSISYDCRTGRRIAQVEHKGPPRYIAPKRHDHPIERVRSRGKGNIHATGDKGARREMRDLPRRGNGDGRGNGSGK
jgi:hypothetical protein